MYRLYITYYEAYITKSQLNFMRGYQPFGVYDTLDDLLDYLDEEFPSANVLYEKCVSEELFGNLDDDCHDVFEVYGGEPKMVG